MSLETIDGCDAAHETIIPVKLPMNAPCKSTVGASETQTCVVISTDVHSENLFTAEVLGK